MSQQDRTSTRIRELQTRWERLSRILDALYQQKDVETRAIEKLHLDYLIAEREGERAQVEAQLQQFEQPQTTPLAQPLQTSTSPSTVATQNARNQKPVTVFYSYAHEDEDLCKQLDTHLKILQRQNIIASWYDRAIPAGAEWEDQIDLHLETADIILLLISADFIASDYCWGKELTRAMERHEANEARVIPIILRELDWTGTPFSRLQALPKDAKPVMSWLSIDAAFTDITKGIREVASTLAKRG